MTQREALEATAEGHSIPAATLELALGLADAVDRDTDNAALWREYRAALGSVMEVLDGSDDDDTAAFRDAVSVPASVRYITDAKSS